MNVIENSDSGTINKLLLPFIKMTKTAIKDGIVCDGWNVVKELIASQLPIAYIVCESHFLPKIKEIQVTVEAPVYIIDKRDASNIIGYTIHQGILALAKSPELIPIKSLESEKGDAIVIHDIEKAENVGSIIRNGAALGFRNCIVSHKCASPYLRRAVRVSMGSVFHMNIVHIENEEEFISWLSITKRSIVVPCLDEGADDISTVSVKSPFAIIFSNEGKGIEYGIKKYASYTVTIPMAPPVDSLNVAAASAIIMHELKKYKSCHKG